MRNRESFFLLFFPSFSALASPDFRAASPVVLTAVPLNLNPPFSPGRRGKTWDVVKQAQNAAREERKKKKTDDERQKTLAPLAFSFFSLFFFLSFFRSYLFVLVPVRRRFKRGFDHRALERERARERGSGCGGKERGERREFFFFD